jgi:flagellar hook assembly protein FlgD
VTLTVYNVLGQIVKILVDGIQNAGYKSVEWDASGIASGVYFYRIKAGNFIETKKMILIK